MLSVVICTYNRAQVLADTLASFASMHLPRDSSFEILIIDNNSSDGTSTVSRSFASQHAYARYVFEPTQGLSHARNRGISDSRGDVIAFADDDVFFDGNWLNAVVSAFERNPSADAMGGRSTPLFDGGRPVWMQDEFLMFYGDTGFGETSRWLQYPEHPFGLNMAFRRHVFSEVGGFNPSLGRIKGMLLSGEESDIFDRINRKGLRTFYAADAHLFHRIPLARADIGWILSRYYWQGVSDAVFEHQTRGPSKVELVSSAISAWKRALSFMFGGSLSPRAIYWHRRSLSTKTECAIQYFLGNARQNLRLAMSRKH